MSDTTTTDTTTDTTDTTVVTGGSPIPTNVTFFNDTSSFSGVDLFKYAETRPSFNGHRVYPAAVHHDHASKYMYGVFRVEGEGLRPIHVHIVDICNRKDAPCANKDKNGGLGFLIDVHQSGWEAIGQVTGVYKGQCTFLGYKGPNTIPTSAFLEGSKTYVMCRCTGRCEDTDQVWKPVGTC